MPSCVSNSFLIFINVVSFIEEIESVTSAESALVLIFSKPFIASWVLKISNILSRFVLELNEKEIVIKSLFIYELPCFVENCHIKNITVIMIEGTICCAAKEMEIPIIINRYTNCSGSLIAVLNRTMDNAPTRPKDNANEALIEVMIKNIANENA